MSVLQSDLRFYGSASMSDTTGTTGGVPTVATKVFFADVTSAVIPKIVSSSASDTAITCALTSLTAAGVLQTDTLTASGGLTPTAGSLTAARLMKGIITGTAVGDIAILGNELVTASTCQAGSTTANMVLKAGDGASVSIGDIIVVTTSGGGPTLGALRTIIAISTDTVTVSRVWNAAPTNTTVYNVWTGMQFDLSPNQITTCRRVFYGAYAQASSGATNTWYEKIFAINDNTATTLTSAVITKQTDPVSLYSGGGTLNFSLCNALDDTSTITTNLNPGSPPTSNTAYSSGAAPQSINVPSPQNLVNGAAANTANAQGIWLQLVLAAGEATVNSFVDMRITGQTI